MLPFALSRSDSSLGAGWAFSIQPVLPSDCRPVVLLFKNRTWARRLTQSPELGLGFCLFSSGNDFDLVLPFCFTQWSPLSLECCCATVRTLLRLPTSGVAIPPAFWRWQRWRAPCRLRSTFSVDDCPQCLPDIDANLLNGIVPIAEPIPL